MRRPAGRAAGWAAVAFAVTLGLGACGSAEDGAPSAGDQPGGGADATEPAPAGEHLEITVTDGAGTTTTWTLTCDPAGGTHPDPAAACAALEKNAAALKPVAKDSVCTMIYGGDDRARITGTWQGEPVDASFSLASGCEIARWGSLEPLLPAVDGASTRRLTS